MPRIVEKDKALVEHLHKLVFTRPEFRDQLSLYIKAAYTQFDNPNYIRHYFSKNIAIDKFLKLFPKNFQDKVKLCRLFVLKQGQRIPHPEIHRNSIQRLVSFQGEGMIHCATLGKGGDKNYVAYPLVSPDRKEIIDLNRCWDMVPANTWHFPEASKHSDWITVTFHSAGAKNIIDEYADENT